MQQLLEEIIKISSANCEIRNFFLYASGREPIFASLKYRAARVSGRTSDVAFDAHRNMSASAGADLRSHTHSRARARAYAHHLATDTLK